MNDRPARAAAFFDLDKTLMAGSSGIHFGRSAYRDGLVSRRTIARWGRQHLAYRLRGASDEQAEELLGEVTQLLRGVPAIDIARMAPELLAGILPRLYPQMVDEVRAHQDAGRSTFIVSAAGNELVSMLAEILGMTGGIGTAYAVGADGRLTGQLDGPFMYGQGKVEAIRMYADQHEIDLEASFAYSDSASDLPMLRCVANPVVVNPDPELTGIAKAEGWRIMRFEKLGRRLAIASAMLVAAAVGGSGTFVASRRR